jgi:sugar (pentulose or hexulose) kinase
MLGFIRRLVERFKTAEQKAEARRWHEYTQRKNAWIERHPNVNPREIEAAVRRILTELGL